MEESLDMGLHDMIGDDFLAAHDVGEPLFNGQGTIDFPDNGADAEEDYLTLGLAAFEEEDEQEFQPREQTNAFGRSFSMNDIQSLQHSPQPVWIRQVSARPALQSVPEGGPSQDAGMGLGRMNHQADPMQTLVQPPPPGKLNLPPLQSYQPSQQNQQNYQQNYSYMQFAGQLSKPRGSFGFASSSESGPEAEASGDLHSTTDGPYLAPSGGGSLQNSRPSLTNLSAQMDDQLQIKRMKSENNLVGIVGLPDLPDFSSDNMVKPPQQPQYPVNQGVPVTTTLPPPLKPGSLKPSLPTPGGYMGGYSRGPPGHGAVPAAGPAISSIPKAELATYQPPHLQQQGQPQLPGLQPTMHPAMAMLRQQAPSGMPIRKSQSALELVSWRNTTGDLAFWDPTGQLAEQLHSVQGVRTGRLTPEERLQKILRYRQKRQDRNFNRTIKYQCRKSLADTRPRVRGRFARTDDVGILFPHQTKKAQREKLAQEEKLKTEGGGAPQDLLPPPSSSPLGQQLAEQRHSASGMFPAHKPAAQQHQQFNQPQHQQHQQHHHHHQQPQQQQQQQYQQQYQRQQQQPGAMLPTSAAVFPNHAMQQQHLAGMFGHQNFSTNQATGSAMLPITTVKSEDLHLDDFFL